MNNNLKEPKRVLHIMPGFGGGISSHILNIIKGVECDDIIIDVASFTNYPNEFIEEISRKNGKVFTLSNVRINKIFKNINEYKQILKNEKYDVVHMHLTDFQAIYFSILSRIYNVKRIISHAHIADSKDKESKMFLIKNRFFQKLTILAATDLVSCSKLASEFRFGKRLVDDNKIMHIPNSISKELYFNDISEFDKSKYIKELKIKENQLVIGNIGFFGYQKNHPFMLKIIKRMVERNIDFVWLFIGDGYNLNNIINEAKALKIDDKIRFLGRRKDVYKLYKIMSLTILPSFFEGLPTVTIETQAAGTPTVISDVITTEVDMGLGLVKRVSLNRSIDEWIDEILNQSKLSVPNTKKRLENIEKRCFTCNEAAKLYTKFINNEIKTYNLGDQIEW